MKKGELAMMMSVLGGGNAGQEEGRPRTPSLPPPCRDDLHCCYHDPMHCGGESPYANTERELGFVMCCYIVQFHKDTHLNPLRVFNSLVIPRRDASSPVPVSAIVGAKVKTPDEVVHTKGNASGKTFPNQVTIILRGNQGKDVNIFLFRNSAKVVGVSCQEEVGAPIAYLLSHLRHALGASPVVVSTRIALLNCHCRIGALINREALVRHLRALGYTAAYEETIMNKVRVYIPHRRGKGVHKVFINFSGFIQLNLGCEGEEAHLVHRTLMKDIISHLPSVSQQFVTM